MRLLAFTALLLSLSAAVAQPITNNLALGELRAADQRARQSTITPDRWAEVKKEDEIRQSKVLELLRQGLVRTDEDFTSAALIFQHGGTTESYRLAHSLASVATTINPENKFARWLTAATWDRLMLSLGRPQWYGTQFVPNKSTGKMELYTVDESAITDDERRRVGVPTLAEAKARAAGMR